MYRVHYDAATGDAIAFSEIVEGRTIPTFNDAPFIDVDINQSLYASHKVDLATLTLVVDPERGQKLSVVAPNYSALLTDVLQSGNASMVVGIPSGGKSLEERVAALEAQMAALTMTPISQPEPAVPVI